MRSVPLSCEQSKARSNVDGTDEEDNGSADNPVVAALIRMEGKKIKTIETAHIVPVM